MVFLNELKKALNRTTIGVLICVLILNAILIISGENHPVIIAVVFSRFNIEVSVFFKY